MNRTVIITISSSDNTHITYIAYTSRIAYIHTATSAMNYYESSNNSERSGTAEESPPSRSMAQLAAWAIGHQESGTESTFIVRIFF